MNPEKKNRGVFSKTASFYLSSLFLLTLVSSLSFQKPGGLFSNKLNQHLSYIISESQSVFITIISQEILQNRIWKTKQDADEL